MEFSRQEYWSRLPFPTPGDLPNTGNESASPAMADSLYLCGTWEAFGFFWLVLNGKQEQKLGTISVVNEILANWVDCHRSYYLSDWIVSRDSSLTSCKSILQ